MDPNTKIVYGYVDADRTYISGSGDFTIGLKDEDGIYDITFDTGFDSIPVITGTVLWNDKGHLQGMQVASVSERQFQIITMETDNYERVDRPFFFTAIGTADD